MLLFVRERQIAGGGKVIPRRIRGAHAASVQTRAGGGVGPFSFGSTWPCNKIEESTGLKFKRSCH